MIQLGGNIELVGFGDLDHGSTIVLKKMVGNHVRKMNDLTENFEKLTITMKPIGAGNNKYEVKARVFDGGKPVASSVTDFNLFVTMDKALSKVQNGLQK